MLIPPNFYKSILKMVSRKEYKQDENKILALYKTWKLPLCQAVLKDRTKTYERLNALDLT
jgi:hypothetical protein